MVIFCIAGTWPANLSHAEFTAYELSIAHPASEKTLTPHEKLIKELVEEVTSYEFRIQYNQRQLQLTRDSLDTAKRVGLGP